jgi:hypothetical protein
LPAAPQNVGASAAAAAAGGSGAAAHVLALLVGDALPLAPPILTTIFLIICTALLWRARCATPSRAPPVF